MGGRTQYGLNNFPIKSSNYRIKKYADKLKGGCEYDFPNEFSVKEWETGDRSYRDEIMPSLGISRRVFLLKRGDGCRDIHSDYFVNALFADYKELMSVTPVIIDFSKEDSVTNVSEPIPIEYPNWIMTDVRFENEAQAIKDRGGIVIRVNRGSFNITNGKEIISNVIETDDLRGYDEFIYQDDSSRVYRSSEWKKVEEHISETALDGYDFDHVIDNDSDLEGLIEKVKQLNLV